MASIRSRNGSGKLFLDFRYHGVRCREQTLLDDTPANRRKLQQLADRVEAEITLGTLEYAQYFPNSKMVERFKRRDETVEAHFSNTPLFKDFTNVWLCEMEPQWRNSYKKSTRLTIERYLLPEFGNKPVDCITKAGILEFRAKLVTQPGIRKNTTLSASRVNHIMMPLRMILNEAADRYDFQTPYRNIKPLKVPRTDVEPFDLSEVQQILDTVRPDFKPYYTVRFFTGLRTAEIDGLQWQHVDLKRRQILVRQALVEGELVYTKNDGSFRTVDMSSLVYDALIEQQKATGNMDFVFCNSVGAPLRHNDVTKKVWHPLLRLLGLKPRRPYQTRHTAATLWLAAGESPEWIARQMGHTSTEMLFTVYSRYVPNLTRRDGSAFERLITQQFMEKEHEET